MLPLAFYKSTKVMVAIPSVKSVNCWQPKNFLPPTLTISSPFKKLFIMCYSIREPL